MIRSLLFSCICLFYLCTKAQDPDLNFARHLYKRGYFREALLELSLQQGTGKYYEADSLQYYTAICLNALGRKDSAIDLLLELSPKSLFSDQGRMYASLLRLELGQRDNAEKILEGFTSLNDRRNQYLAFQKDALDLLLKRDTGWTCSLPELRNKLSVYNKTLEKYRKRKPFVAGLLSALVPGLGKVYAGKPRQLVQTLVPITILGLQTWEGYRHLGLRSARFWVFGSMATVFYFGNIYGSAIAVRVAKKEQYEMAKNQIIVDMRIALHDLFGDQWK